MKCVFKGYVYKHKTNYLTGKAKNDKLKINKQR